MKTQLRLRFAVLFLLFALLISQFTIHASPACAQMDPNKLACKDFIHAAFNLLLTGQNLDWVTPFYGQNGAVEGYYILVDGETAPLLRDTFNVAYSRVYEIPYNLGKEYNDPIKMRELISTWANKAPDKDGRIWLETVNLKTCDDDDFWNWGRRAIDELAYRPDLKSLPLAAISLLFLVLVVWWRFRQNRLLER